MYKSFVQWFVILTRLLGAASCRRWGWPEVRPRRGRTCTSPRRICRLKVTAAWHRLLCSAQHFCSQERRKALHIAVFLGEMRKWAVKREALATATTTDRISDTHQRHINDISMINDSFWFIILWFSCRASIECASVKEETPPGSQWFLSTCHMGHIESSFYIISYHALGYCVFISGLMSMSCEEHPGVLGRDSTRAERQQIRRRPELVHRMREATARSTTKAPGRGEKKTIRNENSKRRVPFFSSFQFFSVPFSSLPIGGRWQSSVLENWIHIFVFTNWATWEKEEEITLFFWTWITKQIEVKWQRNKC